MADGDRVTVVQELERDAEELVAYQLDLLAQIEVQLRAVHQTMRLIERMRGVKLRVGPELSDDQRLALLSSLSTEVDAIDKQLSEKHECCVLMQRTIKQMHARLANMKHTTAILLSSSVAKPYRDDSPELN